MTQAVHILRDGPHTLMTLQVLGRYTNALLYRGSILGIWTSAAPATFELYAESRRTPRGCPTCTGFADCDGGHD
jgi:hypothetical protein